MKSRIVLIILSAVAVAALCGCALFYQSDANNKVLLAQTQATLETLRAENDDLKSQIAELEKKIETEKQEQEKKAAEEAAKKAQEEALKEAQKEADKASSSSTVSKPTPPKTPAKPTTPGGTNGNNTTSKPSTPSNSGSGDIGSPTEDDWNKAFGGEGPKQSGDGFNVSGM